MIERYKSENEPTPRRRAGADSGGALAMLPDWDATAGIGAEALERLLELRGLDYAPAAVVRWSERLPES